MLSGTILPTGMYVMVDNKLRLLTAIKKFWGDRVTTVFPRLSFKTSLPRTMPG